MQPTHAAKTTLAGGLTTLWPITTPSKFDAIQNHFERHRAIRAECRALVLKSLANDGPQTSTSLSKFGEASKQVLEKILLEMVADGLIARSRQGNRASAYFYKIAIL